jgi:hypothetical protein
MNEAFLFFDTIWKKKLYDVPLSFRLKLIYYALLLLIKLIDRIAILIGYLLKNVSDFQRDSAILDDPIKI